MHILNKQNHVPDKMLEEQFLKCKPARNGNRNGSELQKVINPIIKAPVNPKYSPKEEVACCISPLGFRCCIVILQSDRKINHPQRRLCVFVDQGILGALVHVLYRKCTLKD